MTIDDVKKELERSARLTGKDVFIDAYKIITEQEKSLQEAQDNILSLAQQNQEYREQQVKQAKIDVLNELKGKMFEREYMGVKYKERIFYESEIDDMIVEVQNGEDKS